MRFDAVHKGRLFSRLKPCFPPSAARCGKPEGRFAAARENRFFQIGESGAIVEARRREAAPETLEGEERPPDMTRDLFGDVPGPAQQSFFGEGEGKLQAPLRSYLPDPAKVRAELRALLETARTATEMPWSERDAGYWQLVFPNMANWLPEEEARQLRFEFAREMERLAAA
jgi:hypothetical protein